MVLLWLLKYGLTSTLLNLKLTWHVDFSLYNCLIFTYMNKLFSCITALFSSLCVGYAQTGYVDAGAHAQAMGNAAVTFTDVFSIQNNPAAMGMAEHAGIGLSTQSFFMVEGGLNAIYGTGILPTRKSGTLGMSLHYTGDATFNQTKIGLGYGRKLADVISVGIQLDYVGTQITETGSGQAFTFDIGVLYKPTKNVSIGAKAFNPVRVENGMENPEPLPALINAGISWKLSDKVIICAEGEQEIEQALRMKTGIEYHIVEVLYLRGGYISNPSMFCTGFGLQLKTFQLDAAVQFHQQLGASPSIGLRYTFE